jgi:hypothetical protein
MHVNINPGPDFQVPRVQDLRGLWNPWPLPFPKATGHLSGEAFSFLFHFWIKCHWFDSLTKSSVFWLFLGCHTGLVTHCFKLKVSKVHAYFVCTLSRWGSPKELTDYPRTGCMHRVTTLPFLLYGLGPVALIPLELTKTVPRLWSPLFHPDQQAQKTPRNLVKRHI